MNSNLISSIISKVNKYIKPDTTIMLGRWAINDCHKTRNIKIDLSNEDHCGSCSHYRLKQIMRNTLKEIREKNKLSK
jgi:hypothetical protein